MRVRLSVISLYNFLLVRIPSKSDSRRLSAVERSVGSVLKSFGYNTKVDCARDHQPSRFLAQRRELKSPTGGDRAGNGIMKQLKIFIIVLSSVCFCCGLLIVHYLVIKWMTSKKEGNTFFAKRWKYYLKKYTTECELEEGQARYEQTE